MAYTPKWREHEKFYLTEPGDESCYEYMLSCYERFYEDIGEYDAFVVPVANVESSTPMKKFIEDIESFAAFINAKGFKKGDVFTVFLPTCAHAAVAFYAFNKLGIIVNFVHPLTPPAALEEIIEVTKSKGILMLDLFASAYESVLQKHFSVICSTSDYCDGTALQYALYNEAQNAKVPALDTITRYKEAISMELPKAETVKNPGKEDAFYMHGGGTTGKSKTIRLSSYCFNGLAYKYFMIDPKHDIKTAHCIAALPCFHAYGLIAGIHYAISNCYKPIMMPKFDPRQANELIKKYNIAEILGVPKMFQKMMEEDNFDNEGLKNMLVASAGGDVVPDSVIDKFDSYMEKYGSPARLGRGYGLTENCGAATSNNGTGGTPYKKESTGYPMYGITLQIWDDNAKEVPAGTVGEVCVTSDIIMNGYLPDGIIIDSGLYYDDNGTPWIRTGDMGYVDEDGFLFFAGRKKRIIIIAGYNIYPATIEEKIDELPYISEVCAVQGYDSETGKPLVKLCVSLTDKDADKNEAIEKLKVFCKENLESYACPRKYEVLDLLPRTKMEKIDFIKLSDPIPQ